jgi:hypothetical protein
MHSRCHCPGATSVHGPHPGRQKSLSTWLIRAKASCPALGKQNRNFKSPFLQGKIQQDLLGVNHAKSRSRIGEFPGHSSALSAKFLGVLASRASAGHRGVSAQGGEPEGRGKRPGIRPRLDESEVPRWRPERFFALQSERGLVMEGELCFSVCLDSVSKTIVFETPL